METNIFKYTNYRKFLADFYEYQKSQRKNFSYQEFASRCGFKTKTFLYNVIKGKKALPKSGLFSLCQGLKLKGKEAEYFETLVFFNEAKNSKEKEYYFEKLQSFNKNGSSKLIRENQFEFYSNWYHLAIREIIQIQNFSGDYNKLAKAVFPPITVGQAKKAVQLLLEMGFIKKLASGRFAQSDSALSTGNEVKALAIQKFHKKNLELAAESIDTVNQEFRDISSLTFGISQEATQKIKQEIQLFRKKMVSIIEKEKNPDRVYQLGFQLFPISLHGSKGVKI